MLGPALLGSVAFLVISAVFALLGMSLAGRTYRKSMPFVIGTRDFAVAAALASEAFGPSAATVAGVYGVLMLILGAAVASFLNQSKRA